MPKKKKKKGGGVGRGLENSLPCFCCFSSKAKQAQLLRKYHWNEHIIEHGRINRDCCQKFHMLQAGQQSKGSYEILLLSHVEQLHLSKLGHMIKIP